MRRASLALLVACGPAIEPPEPAIAPPVAEPRACLPPYPLELFKPLEGTPTRRCGAFIEVLTSTESAATFRLHGSERELVMSQSFAVRMWAFPSPDMSASAEVLECMGFTLEQRCGEQVRFRHGAEACRPALDARALPGGRFMPLHIDLTGTARPLEACSPGSWRYVNPPSPSTSAPIAERMARQGPPQIR